jgi:hypothetical protein
LIPAGTFSGVVSDRVREAVCALHTHMQLLGITSKVVGLGAVQDVVGCLKPMGDGADGGIASLNWLTENHIADPGSAREV